MITSVVVGLIAIVLTDGLSNGMINQMLFNQIKSNIAHIQIHKKGFDNDKTIKNFIPDYHKVESVLMHSPYISKFSERVITNGILSSADNSSGIEIYGIHPNEEANISIVKNSIIEGTYPSDKKLEIAIGKKLADKLSVGVGDKVVAMTNTLSGDIGTDVFRITGIFRTASSDFDKTAVYIPVEAVQRMLNLGDRYNEFAILPRITEMYLMYKRNWKINWETNMKC